MFFLCSFVAIPSACYDDVGQNTSVQFELTKKFLCATCDAALAALCSLWLILISTAACFLFPPQLAITHHRFHYKDQEEKANDDRSKMLLENST